MEKLQENIISTPDNMNDYGVTRSIYQNLFTVPNGPPTVSLCCTGPDDVKRNYEYLPEKIRAYKEN